MGRYERTIQVAINEATNEIIEAKDIFGTYKEGYQAREQIHTKELKLICCECGESLTISSSKYQKLHFKHYPGHDYCSLSSGNLNAEEIDIFNRIQVAKESDRHKFLKNEIGNKLKLVEGIDAASVAIDNKFIVKGSEKRRPDVYCRYKGKEIVFEIQLSELSLGYILSRYNFYKKHDIYLVWILDDFDVRNPPPFARDIKYLAPYQNYFKLDENSVDFKLLCEYKLPQLTQSNTLLTPWTKSSITLGQMIFEPQDVQVYFYDFPTLLAATEKEKAKKDEEKLAEEQKIRDQNRLKYAKELSKNIITEIRDLKQRKALNYERVEFDINQLDEYELQVLNDELGLSTQARASQALPKWIRETTRENIEFLRFILRCERIALNVNEKNIDGTSNFLELCNNSFVSSFTLKTYLFKRGYNLTIEDKAHIENELEKDHRSALAIYLLLDNLENRSLVDLAFSNSSLLYIIESAKRKKIFGSRLNDWVAFANNAIEYYDTYWESILHAFEYYEIIDLVIAKDHKRTFRNKLNNYNTRLPSQSRLLREILIDLYPEAFLNFIF